MKVTFIPQYRDKIKWFDDSPDAGDPRCICSKCEQLIGEGDIPIRMVGKLSGQEARFHIKCFGEVTGLEIHLLPMDYLLIMPREDKRSGSAEV